MLGIAIINCSANNIVNARCFSVRMLQHVGNDAILVILVRHHFWLEAGGSGGDGTGAFYFLPQSSLQTFHSHLHVQRE